MYSQGQTDITQGHVLVNTVEDNLSILVLLISDNQR